MRAFAATYVAATVVLAGAIGLGQRAFGPAAAGLMLVVLVPTIAVIRWLGLPTLPPGSTGRGAFGLAIVGTIAILIGLYVIFGRPGALVAPRWPPRAGRLAAARTTTHRRSRSAVRQPPVGASRPRPRRVKRCARSTAGAARCCRARPGV